VTHRPRGHPPATIKDSGVWYIHQIATKLKINHHGSSPSAWKTFLLFMVHPDLDSTCIMLAKKGCWISHWYSVIYLLCNTSILSLGFSYKIGNLRATICCWTWIRGTIDDLDPASQCAQKYACGAQLIHDCVKWISIWLMSHCYMHVTL
jgi:hypothetical protein